MRQPLKERIQHAINQAMFCDEVEYGALIVGGRRVTRKRRKHKTVKKDQNNNNNKKTNKQKQSNKNKKLFKHCQDDEVKNPEKSSLVEHDSLQEVRNKGEAQATDGQVETQSTTSMAFNFFKKKSKPEDQTAIKDEEVTMETTDEQLAVDKQTAASEDQISVTSVKDAIKEIEAQDGGSDKSSEQTSNGVAQEKIDGEAGETKQALFGVKKEDSPLIVKESKVRDSGPGVLCCTIL